MIDRTYQNMLTAAKYRLAERKPQEIAVNANITYDENEQKFFVDSLGTTHVIKYPDYESIDRMESWYHLLVLHYMDLADGTKMTGKQISFGELKDGLIRGTKFDLTVEYELQKILKGNSEERIKGVLEQLGGVFKSSKADLCAEIPFFPMYPVTMNIWFADDEYPASGKMLLDESADHYLTIEDAVTVGDVILKRIAEILEGREF